MYILYLHAHCICMFDVNYKGPFLPHRKIQRSQAMLTPLREKRDEVKLRSTVNMLRLTREVKGVSR